MIKEYIDWYEKKYENHKSLLVVISDSMLFLSVSTPLTNGCYIETKEHKEFEEAVTKQGYLYYVCETIDEFIEIITFQMKHVK